METIISTKKNNRSSKGEAEWNSKLLENVGKMRVRISVTKTNERGALINLSGNRDISSMLGCKRAHFAVEGHKLYIVPSMDGYWLPRANGWKATLSSKEIVDALKPYAGAMYPMVLKLMDLAGIPDFPMYYIDLNEPMPIHKDEPVFKRADGQMTFA